MRSVAVANRIEGDFAGLFVGETEVQVNMPLELLPYVHEGAVLSLSIEKDDVEETR